MINNLLVITEDYPYKNYISGTFIKQRIDFLKDFYNNIYVISPKAYFPKWAINHPYIKNFCGYLEKPINYSYDNVKIFFPKYIPLPTSPDYFMRLRLSLSYNVVNNIIKNEDLKFNLIHAHFIGNAGYIGRKLKSIYKRPFVLTAHGGDVYALPFKNEKWLEIVKKTLDSADRIITVSNRNCKILVDELGVPRDKIRIIPNGFDPKRFRPLNKKKICKKLNLATNKKIILSIGNLIEIKGHEYLIKAMNILIKFRKDVICFIIGHGSANKLRNLINELKLEKYIKLIGSKLHEEIPFWINACDLFVLPSLDEGNPTVLVEALGCGKPIVASSVGGVPELLNNKNLGYLVEPKNYRMLAEKICEALKTKWDSNKISEYAKEIYSWNKLSEKVINIHDEVLPYRSYQ